MPLAKQNVMKLEVFISGGQVLIRRERSDRGEGEERGLRKGAERGLRKGAERGWRQREKRQ